MSRGADLISQKFGKFTDLSINYQRVQNILDWLRLRLKAWSIKKGLQ